MYSMNLFSVGLHLQYLISTEEYRQEKSNLPNLIAETAIDGGA